MGRLSSFNQSVADELCEKIATGSKGIYRLCTENEHFPDRSTVFRWLSKPEHKDFQDQYARAKKLQAEFMVEEGMEIADDSSDDIKINKQTGEEYLNTEFVQRSRLRFDARKWAASKLDPKKYGDKLDLTNDGEKFPSPQIIMSSPPKPDDEQQSTD